ncbi:unnamed protein product [Microthlaspi erraticum]|uniref:DDE Tnp4 domain-containing protein n=1 Tax=Microthlaspi erraticum TaxID=1685480 RepID=A0A6D2HMI6_9BRAS|nr:unnamed protein product [Microthlaspi erraticum]CAA7060328.1 unnamed protein product [Microthlaspi erraticum]
MDGVHVCVKVKPEVQGMYWNRHNITSFNIMAICDLNMLFTYVWNGAPGSCHDTSVLTMAQENDSDFPLPPPDKYYLVDSGYPNKQGFLAPFRSSRNVVVRYHMSQFESGPPPRNKQELFNRYHASLRSVIERTFGVWKKKWRILCEFPRRDTETGNTSSMIEPSDVAEAEIGEGDFMANIREHIASTLWADKNNSR